MHHLHFALAGLALASSAAEPSCLDFGGDVSSSSSSASPTPTSKPPLTNVCRPENRGIVEMVCTPPSKGSPCDALPELYRKACIGGCAMNSCPPGKITCQDLLEDGYPCNGSCADLESSVFWADLMDFAEACAELTTNPANYSQCIRMGVEQDCPTLEGTGWMDKIGPFL